MYYYVQQGLFGIHILHMQPRMYLGSFRPALPLKLFENSESGKVGILELLPPEKG